MRWSRVAREHVPPPRARVHWTRTDGAEMTTEGFLDGVVDGHYVLRRAHLLVSALETEPLDGEVRIPRERVEFVQIVDRQVIA